MQPEKLAVTQIPSRSTWFIAQNAQINSLD